MTSDAILEQFTGLFVPVEPAERAESVARCVAYPTNVSALKPLNARLPARLPKLYEQLITAYRWPASTLREEFLLFANPPGSDFAGLESEIFRDSHFAEALFVHGYVQFASSLSGDPICFSTNCRAKLDYPIIQLDREQIVLRSVVKTVRTIAPSFQAFVEEQIAGA